MTADPSAQELSPIKRALLEMRNLRARIEELENAQTEPIAIIGMGVRFPGMVNDAESYWELLHNGVDAISEIPPERWSLDDYYDPDATRPGKMTTRHGGFLQNIDQFDAAFFGISPREAESMDPQQRLLLQTGWEALENAGQSPEKLLGTQTGVFIGISNSDYFRMLVRDPQKIDTYASTGGTLSVAAGRISYLLGLNGPALAVDTACSSTLVAIHLACQSLRQGESDLALVGGANLILTPEANINFSKAGMMASDGRCKTFDARADGYVRGEGCGMVVLKRLSDALADRDHILAVVRGSAINQDGRSSGLTAPNGPAQEAVIESALRAARVEPGEVDYVETHGTGTSLGDPIEVRALGAVYGRQRDPARPLWIGSVKTNFGHLEAAAGIAGLLKAVLALQHGEIPAHLHFQTPNPHIAWESYPVAVPVQAQAWPETGKPRLAGVSSFGFSGTNAHVILEEAPQPPLPEGSAPDRRQLPLFFSARSETALANLALRFEKFLGERAANPMDFRVIAHLLAGGRSHFSQRLAINAADPQELLAQLSAFREGTQTGQWWSGRHNGSSEPPVVFLFTGQGAHYVNMGRGLFQTEPVFRQVMEECAGLLANRLPVPLLPVLYPEPDSAPGDLEQAQALLDDMTFGQPAVFALEIALAKMWQSWGIEPAAVAGHSLGEYAAAVTAGVLSLADGLALVAERGRLMQALPADGQMLTVFTSEERAAALVAPIADKVSIAALNSPEAVVISGQRDAVQELARQLEQMQIRTRALNISRAAHSPLVEAMLPEFMQTVRRLHFSEPQLEYFSGVTGAPAITELTDPGYWQRHLRQPVRFAEVVQSLLQAGYRCFVEAGPHPTLSSLGQRAAPEEMETVWLPSLRQGIADRAVVNESLARLYTRGVTPDAAGLYGPLPDQKIPLPTYPWEQKSFWWKADPVLPAGPDVQPGAAWQAARSAAQLQSEMAPLHLGVDQFAIRWETLNQLTLVSVTNALCSLGAFSTPGQALSPAELLEKCGIQPSYLHLMKRWLDLLSEKGWLQPCPDGRYASPQALAPQPADVLIRQTRELFAGAPYVADYVIECSERLASVITGRESPLELMFPGGTMERAENLYQNWDHARYFNQVVGAAVQAACHARPNGPLRLLEIGAGTGATTSAVLPMLPAGRATYYFTDVSELFLAKASEKFAAYPFVRYGLLNVETDGDSQGYPSGQFDVVIAANVIHATRSLSETLSNTRNLLASDGLLVLFEATTHLPWFDITTGLIEGWQSFADDLRADSPLLSAARWETLLREAGFQDVSSYPAPGSPASILGETVIIARAPARESTPAALIDFDLEHAYSDQPAAGQSPARSSQPQLLETLSTAQPDERREKLLDFVRLNVMRVLRMDAAQPPARKARLMDLGVDSLMAVELRGQLSSGLNLERKLPATLIFDYPTIEEITDFLLRDVLIFPSSGGDSQAADEPGAPPASKEAEIDSLSDEAVEAMLMEKLKKLK